MIPGMHVPSLIERELATGAALLLSFALAGCERERPPAIVIKDGPSVEGLVDDILGGGGVFENVSFAELIETSTGQVVLPLDPGLEAEAEILAAVREAMEKVLERFNQPGSPTSEESRINEVSSHFEKALLEELDGMPGLRCDYPLTREGNTQRSGYPDLRLVHEASGRVAYLDPKLVKEGSFDSSFRTFYYTPKGETNKVLDDAHHLLLGIEHDGNTGNWKFTHWKLVDLSGFRVRLKAEFQASNQDLYRPDLILDSGDLGAENGHGTEYHREAEGASVATEGRKKR